MTSEGRSVCWRLRWHHPTGGWGIGEPWDRESAEFIAATLRRSGCDVIEFVRVA